MCRQLITCLLPLYTRNEQQQFANEHKETFDYISVYNRRFSGAPRPVSLIKEKKNSLIKTICFISQSIKS